MGSEMCIRDSLYAVIEAILGEKAADITDVPWELRCVWEGGKRANVFE